MRTMLLSLGLVLGLMGSMAYAQDMTNAELAEMALAQEIAIQLGEPAPTSLEAAQTMIRNASPAVVNAAVAVVARANPSMAGLVGAAAVRNNRGVKGLVGSAIAAINRNNPGGTISEEDFLATLEEDPSLLEDIESGAGTTQL